jgi:hypothetical protein
VKFKSALLIGLSAGYVLGTKAGKERYEQIRAATRQFMDNPGVQRLNREVNKTVAIGKERVTDAASRTAEQASTGLADQVGKAREYVTTKTDRKDEQPASTTPAATTASGTTSSTTETAGKQS